MTINQQQTEFISAHAGDLTPEQAAQLLEMAEQGDTGGSKPPEQGGAPSVAGKEPAGAASDNEQTTDPKVDPAAPAATEPDPSKTVILAKDGVHTIGYDKLVEARDDAKAWKQRAEAAQQQLDALQAQAQTRADAGQQPTQADANVAAASAAIDKGIDPAIFGTFSDEDIAKGIATVVNKLGSQILSAVDAKLAPLHQRQAADGNEAHFASILAKHPDMDSLVESTELKSWIAAQPSFVRQGYVDVLQKGTAPQVIELFDLFKQANGTRTPAPPAPPRDVRAAAAAAIAKAQEAPNVPTSLSDLAGGRAGAGASRDEAWSQLEGPALLEAMQDVSPEQIEKFLNRRV
jgi:hypothetical protein